jgi:hypothetical protein
MIALVRHRIGIAAALVLLGSLAWAAGDFLVEDWSKLPVGAKGIPDAWKGQSWGSPVYDMTIVEDGGKKVLHMKSKNEGSTISKDIKGKINLKDTPILEWRWKVVTLPKAGNSCVKATDDQAVQVYVTWRRFPDAVRSRVIGYVWDTTAPAGTICKSEKSGTVTYVIVRAGTAGLGTWHTERRNVYEDFRKIYAEEPDDPDVVSIAIDSNDTGSSSESFIGPLAFKQR